MIGDNWQEDNDELFGQDLDELNAPGFDLEDITEDDFTDDLFAGLDDDAVEVVRVQPKQKILNPKFIQYQSAIQLAAKLWPIDDLERAHSILDGKFLFGDLIEAMLVRHDVRCRDLWVMTLTLTGGNIESLKNLLVGGYVDALHLIVSDYWIANERGPGGLIEYIVDELGHDQRFQMSACRTHAKIVLFDTETAGRQVLSGSANLRSSGTSEQITLERSKDVFEFYKRWMAAIEREFWLLNAGRNIMSSKSIRIKDQWSL